MGWTCAIGRPKSGQTRGTQKPASTRQSRVRSEAPDIGRFPSADHIASYAGTAPIEASSGVVVRHRLSRRGNRQLNKAIHLAAHVQAIIPGPGRDYYRRRIESGNSRTEALRLLKRQIAKGIYRTLVADAARMPHETAV
ncbi:MAG: IS110 family transposase [Vicinamibacterales bacterium]|nr:IS110 family transposase [Vicinamibacterales bacterium]